MRIQGYASRNSVRPGDAIDFMVSVTGGGEYEAALGFAAPSWDPAPDSPGSARRSSRPPTRAS